MAKKLEVKLKGLPDYKVQKTDDKGRVLIYERKTDNLTTGGVWVNPDGKTKKFIGW
jgi:hypothetical protein